MTLTSPPAEPITTLQPSVEQDVAFHQDIQFVCHWWQKIYTTCRNTVILSKWCCVLPGDSLMAVRLFLASFVSTFHSSVACIAPSSSAPRANTCTLKHARRARSSRMLHVICPWRATSINTWHLKHYICDALWRVLIARQATCIYTCTLTHSYIIRQKLTAEYVVTSRKNKWV